ncbi:MAG: T9SS type A sorting domain-containing protein [Ignavibacteriaceae bacterium]|nr:T9SS type A sorting domain-containing protein [Ignavibacteriaceae bacterium]
MKKLIPWLIFFFFLALSAKSFSQWIPAAGNLDTKQWGFGWAIDAVDSNCAVISLSPEKQIYKTLNGGKFWEAIAPSDFSTDGIIDVSMTDSLNIWFGSAEGKICGTSDGGKNWEIQFDDTSKTNFMNYIKMFDSQNGIAMGDGKTATDAALFLKTTDGGKNWNSVNDSVFGAYSGDTWRRLDFVSSNVGYFYTSGLNTASIYKNTDGCKTWKKVQTPPSVHVLNFYDENLGLIYGVNYQFGKGTVYRTTNGGDSWDAILIPDKGWGNDIEFLKNDPSKVWLSNYNMLYFSNDSGKTWTQQFIANESNIKGRDLVFTDNSVGWFLCDSMVYRNLQSDHTYPIVKVESENFSPVGFSLEQNYPNPFNPSTVISYQLAIGSFVTLKIYDVLGNKVATLVNEEQQAGTHNYELEMRNYELSGGVYYYTLKAGNFVQTKGMIYLK